MKGWYKARLGLSYHGSTSNVKITMHSLTLWSKNTFTEDPGESGKLSDVLWQIEVRVTEDF